jgi:hypothetical protein
MSTRSAVVAGLSTGLAAIMGLAAAPPSYAASLLPALAAKAATDCPFDDSAGQIADTQAFGVPGLSPGQVDVRKSPYQPAATRLAGPAGAGFGTAVAVGFLDADHCPDVVVGEPTASGGGAVAVFTGSTSGIGPTSTSTLPAQSAADRFGAAVAMGSRYTGGRPGSGSYVTDLWVGAPGRTVGGQTGAGAVDHYVVPQSGSPTLLETITAASAVVGGQAQAGAGFGSVLSADPEGLLVGVPDEDVNGRADAGAAYWLHIDTSTGSTDQAQRLGQGFGDPSGGTAAGSPEAGDHFGASVSLSPPVQRQWALVGAPGEDLLVTSANPKVAGQRVDAGMVQSYLLQGGQLSAWSGITQDSAGIPGTVEAGDRFGAAVVAGGGQACLDGWMIGSPGEDVGTVKDAGSVTFLPSPPQTCPKAVALTQGKGGLGGAVEAGDEVGATLGLLPETVDPQASERSGQTYLIGAPGEDVGTVQDAGTVTLRQLTLDSSITPVISSFTYSAGAKAGLHYGAVLPLVDSQRTFG